MTRYRKGAIVLVLFPNSDLRTAKRRPAIVVQANDLNTQLSQVVVAMITSNLSRADHPSRILIQIEDEVGQRTGLISNSVILTDNLATVLETAIDRALGSYSDLTSVDQALRHTFGL
jgi:mRNA interferase MazF